MAASFVLSPGSSFIFALLSAASYTLVYLTGAPSLNYNYVAIIGLFVMALIAWLAATNIENALREVGKRAEELDHRVNERTSDLVDALQREHSEASKNEAVLQSIADGVIVFDQNHQAIVINPAACSVLSTRKQDAIGADISKIMGEAVNHEDQAIMRSLVESESSSRMGLKIDWGRKILAISFTQVKLPSVEGYGSVMVFRDITKEAEVDRMKSEFVSIVSHELRTPLTAIKGYVELVLSGTCADPQMQHNFLQVVKNNADRLNDMVEELLDVSRIEAGKIQIKVQPTSIPRIVSDVTTVLQKVYGGKGVELRVRVPDDLPNVVADPARITQVVMNLMSNALKYTLEGHVQVTASVADNQVQIDIRDTGIGMTDEDQAKLFTRFFRASTAKASDIPGTGLGLAITRSLIEMHGGKIWLKSAVGQGSTFSFSLPILPEALAKMAAVAPPRGIPSATPTASPKILIVDDELDTAQSFRHQLETEDYTVLITTHGTDALPLARRERPDLILFDVLIQDVNGVEIMHRLKQDAETQSIPVIVTSIGPGDQKDFLLDAADYLTKPVDREKLLTAVRRVLTAQAANQAR
jgi:PAS domain S-box-containing protein